MTATPTPASPGVAPAHAGVADRLPLALLAAAAVAAEPQPSDPSTTVVLAGTILVHDPDAVSGSRVIETSEGSTFVAAYAPGSDMMTPFAAAAVAADGTYSLRVPVGDLVIGVLSEGRAVFDRWRDSGPAPMIETTVPSDGAAEYNIELAESALVSGSVAVPAGVDISGHRIVAALYAIGGTGSVASAAAYVADDGTYSIGGVPAGEYRLAFLSAATGVVSEWWNDAPTFAKAQPIQLSSGQSMSGVSVALAALLILDGTVPTVSGAAIVGQTLKAAPGGWTSGTKLTYQWFANGVAVPKATTSTLALAAAFAGKKITVKVTGAKPGYTAKALVSAATATVLRPLAAPTPAITGTTTVGQTLKVKPGTWTAGTKLAYQWYISGVPVSKATAASFKIPASAAVKTITVVVTGTKAGYATASKRSKATAAVKGILAAPVPAIKGAALFGSRLTAAPGTWTSGTRLSYQWYANGKAVKGATGSTLLLSASTVRSRITVKVTGTKSGYISAAKVSAATGVVSYPAQAKPVSAWNCPAWAPIKGNKSSMIYHVKSGAYYAKTKPEACFSSEAAAVKAGYRKSKR